MKAKKTALILTLRLRFLVVKTMRVGAAKMIITSDGAYKQAVEGLMREPVTILYLPPLEVGVTDP